MFRILVDALLWPLRFSFGGGGGSGSNVSEWKPQAYAQPYLESAVQQQAQLSSQPYQAYTGQRIAGMNSYQTEGLQNIADMVKTGDPSLNAANAVTLNTLTGSYSNPYAQTQTQIAANPYLGAYTAAADNPYNAMDNPWLNNAIGSGQERLVKAYQRTTMPQTNAMAALSHNFGGSAHEDMVNANQDQLLGALTGVETQYGLPAYQQAAQQAQQMSQFNAGLRQSDIARNAGLASGAISLGAQAQQNDIGRATNAWEAERARQMGMVPQAFNNFGNTLGYQNQMVGVGDVYQGYEQQLLNEAAAEWARAQSYPQQQIDNLLNTAVRSTGGYGTNNTTASTSMSPLSSILGAGLLGYGMFGS